MNRTRVSAWLRLIRFPLALSTFADIAAGACMAHLSAPASPLALILVGLASLSLYSAGMILNGIVDIEEDRRHAPGRPLPSGTLSLGQARRTCVALFLLGPLLALMAGWAPFLIALGIVLVILLYHFPLKGTSLAGPLCLGVIRGLNMSLGIAALGAFDDAYAIPLLYTPILYALYVIGASLVASMEDGATRRPRLLIGLLLCIGSLTEMALGFEEAVEGDLHVVLAAAMVVLFCGWLLVRVPPHLKQNPPALRPFAGLLLTGFYIFDAVVAIISGAIVVGIVITALFPLSRVLARRFPPS